MSDHCQTAGVRHRLAFLVSLWAFLWLVVVAGVPRAAALIDHVRPARAVLVPLMTLSLVSLIIAAAGSTVRLAGIAPRPRRAPAVVRHTLTVGVLAAGVLLASELALRLSSYPPYLYRDDAALISFIRGDYRGTFRTSQFTMPVITNDEGLRNPAPARAAAAARRVLIVGDSVTFGWGVAGRETFVARLAEALRAEGVAVMGAGMPGYGTAQETLLVRRFAPAFRPDVVVLSFTLNDLLDNAALQASFPLVAGRVESRASVSRSKQVRTWVRQHVLVVNPLWDAITVERGGGGDIGGQFREFAALLFSSPEALRANARYQLTLAYVDAYLAEVRALGATPVVMLNGDRHVAVAEDMERLRAADAPATTGSSEALVQTLAQDLRARGALVVDTTPALRAAAADAPVYFAYHKDDHWNRRGHQAAAAALEAALRAGPLAPAAQRVAP